MVILAKSAPGGRSVCEMAQLEKALGLRWTRRSVGCVGEGGEAVVVAAAGCSTAIGAILTAFGRDAVGNWAGQSVQSRGVRIGGE